MTDQKQNINHNYSAFSSIVETISILKQKLLFRTSMQHICFSVWYDITLSLISPTNVIKNTMKSCCEVQYLFSFAARLLFKLQTNKINVAESNTLGQFNMEIGDTSNNTWRRGNKQKYKEFLMSLTEVEATFTIAKMEFLMSLMSLTRNF